MNDELEKKLNTTAYITIIICEIIYIYVTNSKNLSDDEKKSLITLARSLLFLVAIYFVFNAFTGLKYEKNESQYKQVIASILVLFAAFIRITIKSNDIEFR